MLTSRRLKVDKKLVYSVSFKICPTQHQSLQYLLQPRYYISLPEFSAKVQGSKVCPGNMGADHASAFADWASNKGLGPVFQIQLGQRTIVVATSYRAIKQLWMDNPRVLISRPRLYSVHGVYSKDKDFTVGTTPWSEECKYRRKTMATALNRNAIQSLNPMLAFESFLVIKQLFENSNYGQNEINVRPYIQLYTLNAILKINYGTGLSSIDDPLYPEIVKVESEISQLRGTSSNWQDYIPLCRLWPAKAWRILYYRKRQDKYLNYFLNRILADIANGTEKPCVATNILKRKLDFAAVKSISQTMISAGGANISACLYFGIGYLSSPQGQDIQEQAYRAIMEAYPDGDAMDKGLEENIPYMAAFVQELLRLYPVVPMSSPRESGEETTFQNATIPAGSTFFMDAQAANLDPEQFPDPKKFNPSRYFEKQGRITALPHYTYGAGSRMCIGLHIANREMFILFTHLISAFKILPEKNFDPRILDFASCNTCPKAFTAQAKDFKVVLVPRNPASLETWLRQR
ncbi:Phenylacetate 2-hydroxylase [Neolecta irregularis DAH-3]|uniref:Phenylacetate 2-hydroxylase n=1 Tax=Neolecta irregularis (strain DAH-3) TaxID=1198029 RepID=A0A1U7LM82_NEOID|nr:Phenylacetate 2-hydroxylase [Neolecta irregularis DAH-3]|eukprot:OLL23693.1 Phenylacetate 2-hydroxylase [Neolecta irregularis DAH-3]